ncbi:hypothetical protein I203_100512 [Kwoniella mangroviensis CBS 8507]|uniref:uncharacterized protein n=1 Tax=Kwoniella mangroviensis CBS 8507 TaxID=1296122 RepID=UPI00080D4AA9|nr:uncharacterized protein I203_07086 [Kwoniella mangroviensis CBS 8507]OCF63767.1 hypothetical protein I203_07086 [Kwoniella mangroviensis CBS 8507]
MSHLPSLTGMTSLKGFLPTSPVKPLAEVPTSPSKTRNIIGDGIKAVWQEGDLGGGRGISPLLLVTSKAHILQVFTIYNNHIPDDPHITETFRAPEEILSIPTIKYDKNAKKSSVEGVTIASSGGIEQVLSMVMLKNGAEDEPLVAMTVLSPSSRKSTKGSLALVFINLRTGLAVRRIELGTGSAAAVHSSDKAIAAIVAHPVPSIHLFSAKSFEPLPSSPITQVALNPETGLPTVSLSGRLLAFATSDAPHAPGAAGLGSIVTSTTLQPFQPPSEQRRRSSSNAQDTQAAILSSAVEIGGGVARGVWAGLKMGAKAANRARNTRLAKSAPTDSSGTLGDEETDDFDGEAESRSLEESSALEKVPSSSSSAMPAPEGEWIKVVDIFARPAGRKRRSLSTSRRSKSSISDCHSPTRVGQYECIAHFCLPPSTSPLPIDTTSPHQSGIRRSSNNRPHPINHLSFSPDGTQLFAAPNDGRSFHILELHPAGIDKAELGEVKGQVWHLYELRRGHTAATVKGVSWDKDRKWIGVATGKGTVHVFPINPSGGPASSFTHVTDTITNPLRLHPLSTVIVPVARLRPRRSHQQDQTQSPTSSVPITGAAVFTFTCNRNHPLHKKLYCQDISIYRPTSNTLELARISVHTVEQAKISERESQSLQRRGSALTEIMRNRAFGDGSDLGIEVAVKAAWTLPEGKRDISLLDDRVDPERKSPRQVHTKSLARAEIRTHCVNPSILPASIYLSRQIELFSAKPIDDYSPLSIMDIEARQHKLLFRKEVEAFSPLPEHVKPFDEPLLSALHSIIEERPSTQLPGLPNGSPMQTGRWTTTTRIPIRSVTAGVDRMKREYVKAQSQYIKHKHQSQRREKARKEGLGLSFEDEDSISILNPDLSSSKDSQESPSSDLLPTTETSDADAEHDFDEEWNTGWEEEYNKAIEDDGPQELVLGLMDEEEEERRKWEIRRERLKKEYAK